MATSSQMSVFTLCLSLVLFPCNAFPVGTKNAAYRNKISTHNDVCNRFTLLARKRNDYDYDYDDDDDDCEDDDYKDNDYDDRRRRRRVFVDDLNDRGGVASPFDNGNNNRGLRLPEAVSKAVLAGVFAFGIGTGVTVDSAINTNPKDLASRDAIDRQAPNPTLCTQFGASAMAFDQRVFVSFNPFNVYVAQADVKPACVLRPSNVTPILRDEFKLLNEKEVQSCKKNMNTWAFVGNLDDLPQLSCVYLSEDAQNEFLSNPKLGIGEDVYDDDREKMTMPATTRKVAKGNYKTEAQMKKIAADAMKKQGTDVLSKAIN